MYGIALKMLVHDRAKYLGLVFGIAFSTMLMSNQISIFVCLMSRTASQIVDAHEADIWVMDPRVQYVDEVESLTDIQLQRVRSVPGVAWAVPFYKGLSVSHTHDGALQQVIVLGVDDSSLAGVAPNMLYGSVADLRQPDAMIMDYAGFEFMWPDVPLSDAIGREVEINDHRAVIVGICDASAPFATFPVIYTKYSNALTYGGQTRKQMSFILLHAVAGEDLHGLAARISRQTGLKALTWDDFAFDTVMYYMIHTGIPINFAITVALGFMVGAAVVGQTYYIFVLENLRQFGALKAMGVGNATIVQMVLLQAAVVAAIGYGIGIGICSAFFEVSASISLNMRGFSLPWQVMIGTAVAVVVIIAIASFASVRKVMVLDPAIVFRG